MRPAAGEPSRVAPPLLLEPPLRRVGEIELRDARAERGDLERELLGALGSGRLERKWAKALAHLLLDITSALDLERDPSELELRAMPASLELPQPCGLLDERSPVLGLRGEHLLDLALADDRVHRRAEPDVGEQLDEIGAPHGRAIHEVLPLGPTHEPAGYGDLAEVEIRPRVVLVVEDELDLAVLSRLSIAAAGEENVVGLLGAKLRRGQRTRRPDDGIRDVRLARAVRADDDGHARLECDLERVRERLEAADAERAQVHRAAFSRSPRTGPSRRTNGRQIRSGTTPSASSACRAASCSAAFLVVPRPIPSCVPATCAAQTNCRSCGGPSTSSTV